jgi:hypothetical protein
MALIQPTPRPTTADRVRREAGQLVMAIRRSLVRLRTLAERAGEDELAAELGGDAAELQALYDKAAGLVKTLVGQDEPALFASAPKPEAPTLPKGDAQ